MKTTYDSFQHFLYLLQKAGIPPEQALVILDLQKDVMTKLIESSMQSLQANTLLGNEKFDAVLGHDSYLSKIENRIDTLSNRISKMSLNHSIVMFVFILITISSISWLLIGCYR